MTNTVFRSYRIWAVVSAIAAELMLSGCVPASPDIAAFNRIQAKPVQLTHTVHFAPGSATLTPAEAADLQAFVGTNRRDSVTIVGGDSPIADARRAQVNQALDNLGVAHRTAPADSGFAAEAVAVTATREVALPPSCPPWAAIGSFDPSNGSINTLGCANGTNLYLMVADPRDLVSGHPQGPADAAPSVAAVEAYRTGKPSPDLGAGGATTSGGAATGGGGGGSMTSAGGGYGQ